MRFWVGWLFPWQPVQAELSLIVLRALNEDIFGERDDMDETRHTELTNALVRLFTRSLTQ